MPYVRRTKRRPSVSRKLTIIATACAILAVVLGMSGLYLKQQETIEANAESAKQFTPAPLGSVSTVAEPLSAAFIGDSYNHWHNALPETGWVETDFGKGGTGYANGTETGTSYLDRAPEVIAANPDIVVVSGGRNDRNFPIEDVLSAATALFAELRAGLPDAQIVAVSPWWDASEPHPALPAIGDAVQSAVETVGGTYIDSGQPLAGKPELITDDGVHPNDEGYAVLAASVAEALKAASEQP